jgi:hypothetical protein
MKIQPWIREKRQRSGSKKTARDRISAGRSSIVPHQRSENCKARHFRRLAANLQNETKLRLNDDNTDLFRDGLPMKGNIGRWQTADSWRNVGHRVQSLC